MKTIQKCVCGSGKLNKAGYAVTRKGRKPRMKCQSCGRSFYAKKQATGGKK